MKSFARIDVIFQAILIVIGLALGLAMWSHTIDGDYFYVPYFLVGGWQIFSVIVHLVGEGLRLHKLRKIYLITLLIVLVILIGSMASEAILFSLMGLLFFSPFMAVFYWFACFRELELYDQVKPAEAPPEATK